MGFRAGAIATVFDIKEGKGNYMDGRLAISRKNKNTGEYETDWSGFCRFVGDAKSKAGSLKIRDRIKLGDVDVTNIYNKERNTTYTNYTVFDFQMADEAFNNKAKATSPIDDGEADDDMPF